MKYKKQVEKEQYLDKKYLTLARWSSYWHQINEISHLQILSILEIGPGNNIVSSVLREMGYMVSTLDIDEKINPDFVDDILAPKKIKGKKFDLILACQILEHLEYQDSLLAIKNLMSNSNRYLIISLPIYNRFNMKINIELIGIRLKKAMCFNFLSPKPKHIFNGEHYWAIGKKGFNLNKIRTDIKSKGLLIIKEFRPFEKTNHYFFVLEKKL